MKFWIKIKYEDNGNICSLYSFDLNKELLNSDEVQDPLNFNYREYIKRKLSVILNGKQKIIPKKYREVSEYNLASKEHIERIDVDIKFKKGVFGITLPTLGHMLNVYALLTNAFLTFMALRLTIESDDEKKSIFLSILGSIFNLAIQFFLYSLSNATELLRDIGTKADSIFIDGRNNVVIPPSRNIQEKAPLSTWAFTAVTLASGACLVGNSVINAIDNYQEGTLLTAQFLKLYSHLSEHDAQLAYELIKWIVIIGNIAAGSYTKLAFEANFAVKLAESTRGFFSRRQKNGNDGPLPLAAMNNALEHSDERQALLGHQKAVI